ncbi:hypothetical protein EDD17DRAFT_1507677 [Pisolithus thermaeus]|nr:hypothetical protein EDD17DRAFT_1507677 [Pisolithus thermaeus]
MLRVSKGSNSIKIERRTQREASDNWGRVRRRQIPQDLTCNLLVNSCPCPMGESGGDDNVERPVCTQYQEKQGAASEVQLDGHLCPTRGVVQNLLLQDIKSPRKWRGEVETGENSGLGHWYRWIWGKFNEGCNLAMVYVGRGDGMQGPISAHSQAERWASMEVEVVLVGASLDGPAPSRRVGCRVREHTLQQNRGGKASLEGALGELVELSAHLRGP